MLLKSHISNIAYGSQEWFEVRKAHFTSSEIHLLMEKGNDFSETALKYIYRKVGEEISGIAIRKEIETEGTAHGNIYEPEAIRKYGRLKGLEFVITQKLIYDPNKRFSSTPDFLEIESETKDGLGYEVKPKEVKCPLTYDAFIELSLCETALDIKKVEKKYYWQVIDQILMCGAIEGGLIIYHPDFGKASMKEIPFKLAYKDNTGKYPLKDDRDALFNKKNAAVKKFEEIKNKLCNQ